LSLSSPPLLWARLGIHPRSATPHLSTVGLLTPSIDKVVVPGGTSLCSSPISFVLCWYRQTVQNIVTPLPSAFLVLLVSVSPLPSPSQTFGSAGTLLLGALHPRPDLCFLLMSPDWRGKFKPSFWVLFPQIADRIVLQLPRAFLLLVAFSRTRLLFLSLRWWGYIPPGAFLPSSVPKTHHSGITYSFGSWARWSFTTV